MAHAHQPMPGREEANADLRRVLADARQRELVEVVLDDVSVGDRDRKSTRLNSSHGYISYAVFCLKKKKKLSVSLAPAPRPALRPAHLNRSCHRAYPKKVTPCHS